MRIDLTIRSDDGRDSDIAVSAPDGATWGDVAAAVTGAVPEVVPRWSGRRRLRPEMGLGRFGLATGSVLSTTRAGDDADGPGARVEVIGGARAGTSVPIRAGDLDVGRSVGCAVTLDDPRVSRRHAVLTPTAGLLRVRDLGSTHGTTVDGARVDGVTTFAPGAIVRVGDSFLTVRAPGGSSAALRAGPGGTMLVSRPVREPQALDDRVIALPSRPTPTRSTPTRWGAALLPAVAGAGLAWAMGSAQFLAFAALTPLALAATALGDRVHWRRERRRAAATFRAARDRADHEIAAAVQREAEQRREADPDPAVIDRVARVPGAQLWQRRRGDADLLRVRIGLGDLPSAVRVQRGSELGPAAVLAAVPITIDLQRGPLGVAAPAPVRAGVARWLIAQLATLATPADVEFALLLADDSAWAWARWLPHLRARVATTDLEQAALVEELFDLAERRSAGRAQHTPWRGAWLVVVVDRPAGAAIDQLGAVLERGPAVGITGVCLADRLPTLAVACAQSVHAVGETGAALRVGATDVTADRVDAAWADRVARALAPLRDADSDAATGLPTECRLVDLIGPNPPHPPAAADIAASWHRCERTASTVLGLGADGPVTIDLDRDGPHLLVAGTTGAGKSELLQTLVLGLACRQPPDEVTFLLVDYKGGATFAETAVLPHVVGLVTDLDEHLTRRVLASLDSEVRRRERLLADAGARDRAHYQAATRPSLPRLVIVVDEFAALVQELPGFVPGLVGIAQRGRSLGLHLVLATQRPAGVVSAEIRANLALRIALRVTSVADSADVIDGPEAAGIDRRTPGRAYLRTGTSTIAVQTASVSAAASGAPGEPVRVTRLAAWRRVPREPKADGESDARLLVAAITAAGAGRARPHRPWLPPLPESVPYTGLPPGAALTIPIGVVDRPAQQRQDVLSLDLGRADTVLIVGASRSGRTTALLTLALAAAERCTPDDLHLHVIDAAGSALTPLAELPHAGTVVTLRDGGELAARLVHRLVTEVAARREAHTGAATPPALLLLVDGWEALVSASEEHDGGRTTERLLALLRDAPGAGVTVVLTGGRAALAPRVAAAVRTRLVLALHDPGDYAAAGVPAAAVPRAAPPGRAVRAGDGAEIQLAHPGDAADQRAAVARAVARWARAVSPRIRLRPLPARVTLAGLADVARSSGYLLGVGGDESAPLAVDLDCGSGRLLVAGPARSGRSTALRSVLHQARDRPLIVAAPGRSPLSAAAAGRGLAVSRPGDDPPQLPGEGLLLVDDAEAFAGSAIGDALTEWLRGGGPGRVAVVAGRSDAMAITAHDLAAEVRQFGCGVLLRPGPLDGELLGTRLPRSRATSLPGRGVLVPDPAWQLGDYPIPIQLAEP